MSLELIKKVRQLTGAGMVDVKKALDAAAGDESKAIEILRKAGSKIAAKKAGRAVAEGVIAMLSADDKLAVVVLGCETDFVARNEDFIKTVDELAQKLLTDGADNFQSWANDHIQNELIVKIGENLQLGDFALISGSTIGSYLHSNKKIASAIVLAGGSVELAREIAMHIAATAPKYLSPAEVPAEEVSKEEEIYTEQLKKEGKPDNIIANIIKAKIDKYYTEVCLLKQPFVKDDKQSIEELLKEAKATIKDWRYFSL